MCCDGLRFRFTIRTTTDIGGCGRGVGSFDGKEMLPGPLFILVECQLLLLIKNRLKSIDETGVVHFLLNGVESKL